MAFGVERTDITNTAVTCAVNNSNQGLGDGSVVVIPRTT
jgi:hypothetical protein